MKPVLRSLARYVSALALALWSFTIGFLVSNRARGLIWKIRAHFGLRTTDAIVPEVAAVEAIGATEAIVLAEPHPRDGNVTLVELAAILGFVRKHRPRSLFEIGTFDGRTTLNLALNAPPDAHVYTLDLPGDRIESTGLHITTSDRHFINKPASGARFCERPEADKITQLYGDSATFDFTPYYNSIDLVFLDGSHAYEYVLNDTQVGLKLLRDGHGVVVWHDYAAMPGVTKALNQLFATRPELRGTRHIAGTSLAYVML